MAANLIAFKVSAPGKVILHGEHSVVYGKPAIAGAVGARNFLHFQEKNDSFVVLNYVSVNFQHKIPIEELNDFLMKFESIKDRMEVQDILEKFFIRAMPHNVTDQGRKSLYIKALSIKDKYLYQNLPSSTGFNMRIASELSVGAGLGSSASFGVCLATAFLTYVRQKTTNKPFGMLTNDDKQTISHWAFQSEKIMHGTPSGVDNTVCTFGSIVKFTKSQPIELVNVRRQINILLVDSKVSRSTIKMVKEVADLREEFPSIVDNMLNAMEAVANQAAEIYSWNTADSENVFTKLEKLFEINNNLLRGIRVSHPKLEDIFNIASVNGYSSKITGAGGGGYALILLPDNYDDLESYKTLRGDLEEAGFPYMVTTVGGRGVTVDRL